MPEDWNPLRAPHDHAIVAGQRTPGICRIEGFSTRSRWDVRKGPALTGASLIYKGFDPAAGKMILTLVTAQDWDDWWKFAPVVRRAPVGERARHLQIEHPILAALDIRAVAVVSVGQPTPVDERGAWRIEIELLEHLPPRPTVSAPRGAEDGEPMSANQRAIAERLAAFHQALAGDDV